MDGCFIYIRNDKLTRGIITNYNRGNSKNLLVPFWVSPEINEEILEIFKSKIYDYFDLHNNVQIFFASKNLLL
jgi:hypothetical protein